MRSLILAAALALAAGASLAAGPVVINGDVAFPERPVMSDGTADGKTIYVMAVDDRSAAPYKGKVYAIPNK
jgi:hypothetical protein